MSNQTPAPNTTPLDDQLTALAPQLAFPPTPDLAAAVHARLAQDTPRRQRTPWSWQQSRWPARLIALACLLILLFGAVLILSPTARATVRTWLQIPGLTIREVPTVSSPAVATPANATPTTIGARFNLGARVTLSTAQQRVGFPIALPTVPTLGPPDEIYLATPPPDGQVTLVWLARPDLPADRMPGVGLILSQFRGNLAPGLWQKRVDARTFIEYPNVHGRYAFWIVGGPHTFAYSDASGQPREETTRLAGNVLLWERQGITYRLEGVRTKEEAIAIAESLP